MAKALAPSKPKSNKDEGTVRNQPRTKAERKSKKLLRTQAIDRLYDVTASAQEGGGTERLGQAIKGEYTLVWDAFDSADVAQLLEKSTFASKVTARVVSWFDALPDVVVSTGKRVSDGTKVRRLVQKTAAVAWLKAGKHVQAAKDIRFLISERCFTWVEHGERARFGTSLDRLIYEMLGIKVSRKRHRKLTKDIPA